MTGEVERKYEMQMAISRKIRQKEDELRVAKDDIKTYVHCEVEMVRATFRAQALQREIEQLRAAYEKLN